MHPSLLLGAMCALPAVLPDDPLEAAEIRLGDPQPLLVDGAPLDTGEYFGFTGPFVSIPFVSDLDRDGDQDLLVGNFNGSIEHFENTGDADAPQFESRGMLQAEGEDIDLDNWWCIAIGPQLADLNGDGIQDLVSGCFEGVVYWSPGSEAGFATPVKIRDSEGDPLCLGEFWNFDTSEWDEVDKSEHRSELGISAFPVDWDSDGDLDLLLGSNAGSMYVRLNEGSASEWSFAPQSLEVKVNGELAKVPGGHAQPVAADWDGDGLFDLVSGGGKGGVTWWRNTGAPDAPAFAAPQTLVEPIAFGPTGPQASTQVAVVDFDMDGDLDLVLGDQVGREAPAGSDREMGGRLWVLLREGPVEAEPLEAGAPR